MGCAMSGQAARIKGVDSERTGEGGADRGEIKPAGVGGRLIIERWAAVL
jgi:hypothetical protein